MRGHRGPPIGVAGGAIVCWAVRVRRAADVGLCLAVVDGGTTYTAGPSRAGVGVDPGWACCGRSDRGAPPPSLRCAGPRTCATASSCMGTMDASTADSTAAR